MTAGKVKIVLLIAFLLAAGAVGWWYEFQRVHAGNGALRVSGNIETTEVDISFKIAGRVVNRLVDEGEKVSSGQLIAELDTADLKADVALRQAELQAAQAALAELEAGSRPEEIAASRAAAEKAAAVLAELKAGSRPQEIEAAKAQLIAAEVDENHMEADWRRAEALLPTNAVAKKDYDQAKAAYDVAVKKHRQVLMQYELVKEGPRKEQIDQAQAVLAQAQEQYKLVKEGPRKEDIDQAAKVNQTEASLGLAEVRLGYAKIYSPLAGVVLLEEHRAGGICGSRHAGGHSRRPGARLAAGLCRCNGPGSGEAPPGGRDQHRLQGGQGLPGDHLIYCPGGGVYAQDRAD